MTPLGRRVATALVLLPAFIAALFLLPSQWFALFLGGILLLGGWEWAALCRLTPVGRALALGVCVLAAVAILLLEAYLPAAMLGLAFWLLAAVAVIAYPAGKAAWEHSSLRLAAGGLVLLPAWAALVGLHAMPAGPWLVLWAMLVVWGTDIGGYFAGHAFGRHKLAPRVSPGKTVEGLAGGVLLALAVSVLMGVVAGIEPAALPLLLAITAGVVAAAVVGDLLESLIKRVAGVKDSGTLLPGHGGVLDRVDAVLAAAPVALVLLALTSPRLGVG